MDKQDNRSAMSGQTKRHTLMDVLGYTVDRAKELADANGVVGDKIEMDGITVYPISKLSVGFAGGAAEWENTEKHKKTQPAGAGAGVTRTPLSFLVIQNGEIRVVNLPPEKAAASGFSAAALIAQVKEIAAAVKQDKAPKSNKKSLKKAEK